MKFIAAVVLLLATERTFAQSAAQRFTGATPDIGMSLILQMAMGLALIVALIYLLAWLGKKIQGGSNLSTGALKIIESVALGSRERLLLVQIYDEQVLVGISQGAMTRLHSVDKESLVSLKKTAASVSSINGQSSSDELGTEISPMLSAFISRLNRQTP